MNENFLDVIIPAAPEDDSILELCIKGVRENVVGVNRVILVSPTPRDGGDVWIGDSEFPISKEDVGYVMGKNWRNGWYYQQLLKLYAPEVVENLTTKYLVVDADTVFLRPVEFFDEVGRTLFAPASEFHMPYFEHMARLHPTFRREFRHVSGVAHHMLFDQEILGELFRMVETQHEIPFWNAFLCCVDPAQDLQSGASEYEIYFNFMFSRYREKAALRPLRWANVREPALELFRDDGYDYISIHRYSRKSKVPIAPPKSFHGQNETEESSKSNTPIFTSKSEPIESGPGKCAIEHSMTFLFIVGVEGAGHHLIRSVFSEFLNHSRCIDEGRWHGMFIDQWSSNCRYSIEEMRARFNCIVEAYKSEGVTHLFECASFPFFQPRDSIRRPDLVETYEIVSESAEVKFLVLDRDPVEATLSAVRRRFTDNLPYQAKIVEDNLVNIAAQLTQLESSCYRVIRFDDILDRPSANLEAIADWIDFPREILLSSADKVRRPNGLEGVPEADISWLNGFFSGTRRDRWIEVFNSQPLLQ